MWQYGISLNKNEKYKYFFLYEYSVVQIHNKVDCLLIPSFPLCLTFFSSHCLMVLAAGFKALGPYHVKCFISLFTLRLKWFSGCPHAQNCFALKQTFWACIIHLPLTLSREPPSTWPIIYLGWACADLFSLLIISKAVFSNIVCSRNGLHDFL